jgi:hypothetical protein
MIGTDCGGMLAGAPEQPSDRAVEGSGWSPFVAPFRLQKRQLLQQALTLVAKTTRALQRLVSELTDDLTEAQAASAEWAAE